MRALPRKALVGFALAVALTFAGAGCTREGGEPVSRFGEFAPDTSRSATARSWRTTCSFRRGTDTRRASHFPCCSRSLRTSGS
jgi:hypothetical protein